MRVPPAVHCAGTGDQLQAGSRHTLAGAHHATPISIGVYVRGILIPDSDRACLTGRLARGGGLLHALHVLCGLNAAAPEASQRRSCSGCG